MINVISSFIHCILFYIPHHSHKKRKDSLQTHTVYKEISVVSRNLPNGAKYRRSILKNMASPKGDQPLAGAFHAVMEKIEADVLQIATRKWKWIGIGNEFSYIKDSFSERFQLQMPVLHQCTCTFKAFLWSLGKIVKMFQPRCLKALKFQRKRYSRLWVFAFNSEYFYCWR